MTEKKTGLGQGASAFFGNTGGNTGQAPKATPSPKSTKPPTQESTISKRKATFYIADSVLDELDALTLELKQTVPREQRRAVNKSTLVEALLRTALNTNKGTQERQTLLAVLQAMAEE